MDIIDKLKIVQKVSGLTQTRLAQELEVSFVAFNNWWTGKSKPRALALQKIDQLYKKYTGEKLIPVDVLTAKKQLLLKKSKSYKNILKTIILRQDIYDQLVLELTYHTNSIEGSTMTQADTAAVIFDNVALPNKTITEQLEAKNHQTAFNYLWEYLSRGKKINEALILKLHSILMNAIHPTPGLYRNHNVRIVGAYVPTANFMKISRLMNELIKDINKKEKDIISHVSIMHSRFEQIHPFADGNGRIGRLLMHAMLVQHNLPPAVIKQQNKRLYYTYLSKSQIQNEHTLLEDFICDAIEDGFKIIEI